MTCVCYIIWSCVRAGKKYQKAEEKLSVGERQESCLDLSPRATTSPVGMAKPGNGPNLHFILQKKVAHLTIPCLSNEKLLSPALAQPSLAMMMIDQLKGLLPIIWSYPEKKKETKQQIFVFSMSSIHIHMKHSLSSRKLRSI